MAVEEHGEGRQLIRFKVWPRWSATTLGTLAFLALLSAVAAAGQAWIPALVLAAGLMGLLAAALYESGRALGGIVQAITPLMEQPK